MELIDLRPDRFLKEIRDHGDTVQACTAAGFSPEELEELLQSVPKLRFTAHECLLQYAEEQVLEQQAKKRERIDSVYKFIVKNLDKKTASLIQDVRSGSSFKI